MELDFEATPFDLEFIELVDGLETTISEMDFTQTPKHIFCTEMRAELERLGCRDREILSGVWLCDVNVQMDMSDENNQKKLKYFARRYAKIALVSINKFVESVGHGSARYALSDLSFSYDGY